jgi:ABC-2 type transport system ATP-binding protein
MKPVPILKFENISKKFGDRQILSNLNLEIYNGDAIALIGRSGGGKSTLMKILIGFHKQDEGKIYFKGIDVSKDIESLRKIVGYTTQDNSFYGKLTVYENMLYYAKLYGVNKKDLGKPLKQHIHEILEEVELANHKNSIAESMSGGMQRRLDFAISMLHNPELLILDEPTTGLDPLLVQQFWNIVNKIRKQGKTILVSSHIFSELEENCTKAAVLDKGKIVKVIEIDKLGRKKLYDQFRSIVT